MLGEDFFNVICKGEKHDENYFSLTGIKNYVFREQKKNLKKLGLKRTGVKLYGRMNPILLIHYQLSVETKFYSFKKQNFIFSLFFVSYLVNLGLTTFTEEALKLT